ncbi:hypothetical protein [Lyngbya aestuarii]|uniref:hypothetical protein n=1 Tax=Lyngbya aestuarii TaxID=118322 RepID=UPI00403DAB5C
MDGDTKFALLVIGLPLAGLVYCGLMIALMANSPLVREHPVAGGACFLLIPFVIGASIWIKASAKAYSQQADNSISNKN